MPVTGAPLGVRRPGPDERACCGAEALRGALDLVLEDLHPLAALGLARQGEDRREQHRRDAAHLDELHLVGHVGPVAVRRQRVGVRVLALGVARAEREPRLWLVLGDLALVLMILVPWDHPRRMEPAPDR